MGQATEDFSNWFPVWECWDIKIFSSVLWELLIELLTQNSIDSKNRNKLPTITYAHCLTGNICVRPPTTNRSKILEKLLPKLYFTMFLKNSQNFTKTVLRCLYMYSTFAKKIVLTVFVNPKSKKSLIKNGLQFTDFRMKDKCLQFSLSRRWHGDE